MSKRKIRQLHGFAYTPDALLGDLLERAIDGEFKSVAVSIERHDGTFAATGSQMMTVELLAHARTLQSVADGAFCDDGDELVLDMET